MTPRVRFIGLIFLVLISIHFVSAGSIVLGTSTTDSNINWLGYSTTNSSAVYKFTGNGEQISIVQFTITEKTSTPSDFMVSIHPDNSSKPSNNGIGNSSTFSGSNVVGTYNVSIPNGGIMTNGSTYWVSFNGYYGGNGYYRLGETIGGTNIGWSSKYSSCTYGASTGYKFWPFYCNDIQDFSGYVISSINVKIYTNNLSQIEATGGTITTNATHKIHTFTSNDSFNVTSGVDLIEVLVVAGGGMGGGNVGGGGGAGGLIYSNYSVNAGQNYSVVVGTGGNVAPISTMGANGTYSRFGIITTTGEGGAGAYNIMAQNGGSGGGGSGLPASNYGTGVSGQGNNGSEGIEFGNYGRGGGGGAGGAGSIGTTSVGGNGGAGLNYTINGISVCYAGGGGGGRYLAGTVGVGTCGGGNGSNTPSIANAQGYGAGGGGALDNTGFVGGNGSQGIVIVRYLYNTVTTNSCSYTSGNWNINIGDDCNITTAINLNRANITINGSTSNTNRLYITTGGSIKNFTQLIFIGVNTTIWGIIG